MSSHRTSRPTARTARRLAAATALAALAAAAPAHADSIAYVKGGDLWLSTPDASRQLQVTATGGYSTVSQDDQGNLVALHGDRIRTLDRSGKVKYDILTPASSSMPGTQFRGPFDPAVAPNGLSIAYTWYYTQTSSSPSCNPSSGCQTVYGRQGTGYTRPDRITGFDEDGFRSQSGWVGPSWTTSGGTILSDPAQVGNEQVVVHTPGNGDGSSGGMTRWFNDSSANGLRDVELSPDKQKLAGVSGDMNDKINFYRAKGGHPTLPEGCYALSGDVGRYQQPSWSPDSTRLAFADDQGVNVIAIPDMTQECGTPTEGSRLLIPGAKHPDWGPADVPARAGGPGGSTTTVPGGKAVDVPRGPGAQADDAGSSGRPGAGARLAATRTSLGKALRGGLVVRLTGAVPGRVRIEARDGRTVVARGTAAVAGAGAGTATARLRFTPRARRRLAGRRTVRLTIRAAGTSTTVALPR